MMDEDALRSLVRDVIARHVQPQPDESVAVAGPQRLAFAAHASHFRYALPGSGEACLIEPDVQCNHCGYCQSHGH